MSAQDLVKKNAGGASVHASQDLRAKSATEEKGPEDGIKVLSISGSSPSPMPAKKAPVVGLTYTVGEKVQALWTDGKWSAKGGGDHGMHLKRDGMSLFVSRSSDLSSFSPLLSSPLQV